MEPVHRRAQAAQASGAAADFNALASKWSNEKDTLYLDSVGNSWVDALYPEPSTAANHAAVAALGQATHEYEVTTGADGSAEFASWGLRTDLTPCGDLVVEETSAPQGYVRAGGTVNFAPHIEPTSQVLEVKNSKEPETPRTPNTPEEPKKPKAPKMFHVIKTPKGPKVPQHPYAPPGEAATSPPRTTATPGTRHSRCSAAPPHCCPGSVQERWHCDAASSEVAPPQSAGPDELDHLPFLVQARSYSRGEMRCVEPAEPPRP